MRIKPSLYFLLASFLFLSQCHEVREIEAVEDLTLTTPITKTSTTAWRVDEIHLSWTEKLVNVVFLEPTTGERKICSVSNDDATTLMVTLNKANLTNNSLHKRAINWAIGIGCLGNGTIGGSPE